MAGFETGDLPKLVSILGSLIGMFVHIVKKKTEEMGNGAESELSVFHRWIIKRPFNSVGAAISAVGLALTLQPEGSLLNTFLNALVAGFAADSAVNRPGA